MLRCKVWTLNKNNLDKFRNTQTDLIKKKKKCNVRKIEKTLNERVRKVTRGKAIEK